MIARQLYLSTRALMNTTTTSMWKNSLWPMAKILQVASTRLRKYTFTFFRGLDCWHWGHQPRRPQCIRRSLRRWATSVRCIRIHQRPWQCLEAKTDNQAWCNPQGQTYTRKFYCGIPSTYASILCHWIPVVEHKHHWIQVRSNSDFVCIPLNSFFQSHEVHSRNLRPRRVHRGERLVSPNKNVQPRYRASDCRYLI